MQRGLELYQRWTGFEATQYELEQRRPALVKDRKTKQQRQLEAMAEVRAVEAALNSLDDQAARVRADAVNAKAELDAWSAAHGRAAS